MEYNGGYINGRYGAFAFEDPLSEDENEDIHHALEHSILESKIAEMNFGESYHTEEDEHHAWSIQNSIEDFAESYHTEEHEHHSRSIQSSIEDSDESMRRRASSTSERDFDGQIDRVCDVCDKAKPSARLRLTYWGQKACKKHFSDGSTICCSCLRFKIGDMGYISLSDGRKLCSDCHCTAIMDTEACIPLFHEVYKFLEGIDMKILEDIPIFLVDKKECKRIGDLLGGKAHQGNRPSGLTTYTAGFVVRSVARSYQRGENIYVEEEVHQIQRNKVTSMLIEYGFPRLAMGATLAHEMMHAWMRIQGYSRGIPLEVKEGICEVMAHRWLDWYTFVGEDFLHTSPEQVQFLRNLKEVLKNDIEKRCSKDVYGHGFREAKWAIERYGLKSTMSYVARTGKFPE
ncbi:protein DA1-related 1-like isoform X2 [Apium graveolens]|uniref:protein DA1-related 1-like isoform X2 n=1 Tax=Apium graveolens TaxID=4045 RepID=UPI003D7AABA4